MFFLKKHTQDIVEISASNSINRYRKTREHRNRKKKSDARVFCALNKLVAVKQNRISMVAKPETLLVLLAIKLIRC